MSLYIVIAAYRLCIISSLVKSIRLHLLDRRSMEDEDDIPIAELMRRRALEKAAEKLAQQPPPSQPPKPSAMQQHKSSAPPSTVPRRSIADDDDEEDDIPIAELMRRKAASSSVLAVTVKPSPSKSVQPPIKMKHPKEVHVKEEKKDKKEKKEKKDRDRDRERDRDRHSSKHEDRHKSSTSSSSRPSSGGNAAKTKSGIIYEESTKGALVQKLLVRWWYAIEWPKAGEVEDAPAGFEALDGFPGVFVSTRVRIYATFTSICRTC